MRWIALAAPPAAFVAVYVLSGLGGSVGDRRLTALPRLSRHGMVPRVHPSLVHERSDRGSATPSVPPWLIVVVSQVVFWGWSARHGDGRPWLFADGRCSVFVFALNVAVVGTVRLPGFGVKIAYELRYYPEVVLFLPVALALASGRGRNADRPRVGEDASSAERRWR